MRVFVTGASGWIGSALVAELLATGHQVAGLARSDDAARALSDAGVEVVRGSLDDVDVLAAAAADSEGVVHTAFRHDIAFAGDFEGAGRSDLRAIETFGDALAGTDHPLVIASGLAGLKPGAVATEEDEGDPTQPGAGRLASERAALALAARGVRSSSVRLSPTVHGDGDYGFVPMLVGIAREKGVAGYVGDGANRWPAVHRLDAAHLFRLALEKAPAGSVLHGAAEEGVRARDIAEVFGRRLDLPVRSVAPDELGWLGGFFAADIPASSTRTRELLGWEPTHAGLIADLEEGHYFA